MGFFTRRDVARGEEITFDYKYERYGQEAQKCLCGSENCRGWLGGEPDNDAADEDDDDDDDDDYWSSSSGGEECVEAPSLQPIREKRGSADRRVEEAELATSSELTMVSPKDAIASPPSSPLPEELVRERAKQQQTRRVRRKRRKRRSPRKIKNFEDECENEEELERFKATGIRTKQHTVELCRLMVRTTDLNTRLCLADLLMTAAAPCKRLFLDYHGLRLLQRWMSDLGWTAKDLELKIKIEEVLATLSIPHRTALKESKVWQTVERWSLATPQNEDPTAGGAATETPENSASVTSTAGASPISDEEVKPTPQSSPRPSSRTHTPTPPPPGVEEEPEKTANNFDVEMKKEENTSCAQITKPGDVVGRLVEKQLTPVKPESKPVSPKEEGEDIRSVVESTVSDMLRQISGQDVDDSAAVHDTAEKVDERTAPAVAAISKADINWGQGDADDNDEELMEVARRVQAKAKSLLEGWSSLKDVFKIPKKELGKMRAEHEREADRAAMTRFRYPGRDGGNYSGASTGLVGSFAGITVPTMGTGGGNGSVSHHHSTTTANSSFGGAQIPKPFHSSYERSRPARPESPTTSKRERRVSRFDDQSGLLHKSNINLSREHRRQLFMLKASVEEEERRKRNLLLQQHVNKCAYLRLEPNLTPLFPQHPEYYFDDMTGQWTPMPEPNPKVDMGDKWEFPRMAALPLEAFKEGDPPPPDPAFFYPPGVVPVSYLYGPPPEMAGEYYAEEQQQAHVDPETGEVIGPSADAEATSSRPDFVPFLTSEGAAETGGEIPFLGREGGPITARPEYDAVEAAVQDERPDLPDGSVSTLPGIMTTTSTTSVPNGVAANRSGSRSSTAEIVVRLPPRWRATRDAEGRVYYYNSQTKETSWDPPKPADDDGDVEMVDLNDTDRGVYEMDVVSSGSEEEAENEEDDENGDTDDEDEDEEDSASAAAKRQAELDILASSDLSREEKELLLASKKKKSKEERQHERRQKRERDREKREYERKRRRERHGKHRKDGLVTEHLIPVSLPKK